MLDHKVKKDGGEFWDQSVNKASRVVKITDKTPEEKIDLLNIWQENTELLPEDAAIINTAYGNKYKVGTPKFDIKANEMIDRKVTKQRK